MFQDPVTGPLSPKEGSWNGFLMFHLFEESERSSTELRHNLVGRERGLTRALDGELEGPGYHLSCCRR